MHAYCQAYCLGNFALGRLFKSKIGSWPLALNAASHPTEPFQISMDFLGTYRFASDYGWKDYGKL
jgi:hypothetical protein